MDKKFSVSKLFYSLFIKNWYLLGLTIVLCVIGYWISLFMIFGIILFIINLIISIFTSISIEQSITNNSISSQNNLENDIIQHKKEEDFMQAIYKNCEDKIKMLEENDLDESNELLSENNLSIMARNLMNEVNKKMDLHKIGSVFINECIPFKDARDSFAIIVNTLKNPSIIFIFRFETYSEIKDLKLIVSYQNDINEVIEKVDKKTTVNNEKELKEFLLSEIIIKQITEISLEILEIMIEEEVVLKK